MFMKQYNYKPRSNSTSSQDGAQSGSPPKGESTSKTAAAAMGQANGPTAAAAAGRRRSSASEKFAGLNAHKRGSQDDTSAAKKASYSEMSVGNNGILGGMWNSFTKGQESELITPLGSLQDCLG